MDVGPTASRRERFMSNIKFVLVAGGGLFGDGYLNTTIGLGTSRFQSAFLGQ